MKRLVLGAAILSALLGVACDRISKSEDYCATDADCHGLVCQPVAHTCVASGDGGTTDGGGDANSGCTTTSCPETTPVCGSDGTCRACTNGDDSACAARNSATPRCGVSGTNAGECVACATSADCATPSAPVCGDNGSCRVCSANAECSSGICVQDGASAGQCAPASMVALVDNGGNAPASCKTMRATKDGKTAATAYCDVSDAIAAKGSYALVTGSAQPYSAITLTDQSITIVGPGGMASPTARVFTVGMPAVLVTVNNTATVVLDGLDLGGDTNQSATSGLKLTNNAAAATAASVVLRNALVHDCSQAGVSASGGAVTVARCFIENNKGGIEISSGARYDVENNFIALNLSSTAVAGVSFTPDASGVFRYNTVVGNVANGIAGGIYCGVATQLIQASLVIGNSTQSGTQVSTCTLDHVVTGTDSAGGAIMKTPTFVSNTDFHLKLDDAANEDCCVDQLATGPTTDIDGSTRPKGKAYDIGAHEVQ